MKHFKRANIYKNSTGTLTWDLNSLEGYSYNWYCIAKQYGNYVVLNKCGYSPTTSRHVGKLRSLFRQLGYGKLKPLFGQLGYKVLEVSAPRGLQNLEFAIKYYQDEIKNLKEYNNRPRVHAKTKLKNIVRIDELDTEMNICKAIQAEEYDKLDIAYRILELRGLMEDNGPKRIENLTLTEYGW